MRKKAIEMTTTWNKDLQIGATLEGRFVKTEVSDSKFDSNKKSFKYVIETDDGGKYGVFGSASLDRQFNNVPEGSYVWITYKGEEKSSNGRSVKVYEVEYDDEA